MKKLYYSLFAAAAMLLATSCSQEEELVQQSNGLATFSVSLNGATSARTAGDGQTVDKLYYEVYEGTTKIDGDAYDKVVDMNAGKATVEIPLMKGHTYTIAFWAQNSNAGIYDAEDLTAIGVDYTNATANNEKYDAFYKAISYQVKSTPTTVELTRPFAQLNVGTTTTDWEAAKNLLQGNDPTDKSIVTVAGLANSFNVFKGEATGNVDVNFAAAGFIGENFTLNNVEYKNLAMNYLLVPGGDATEAKATTTVGVTFQKGGNDVHSFEVLYVPVERNYRTNIVGNLFTEEGDFEVIVKPGFNEPAILYPELLLAAANGGTVTLEEDVELKSSLTVAAGKSMTINLNGHDIITNTSTGNYGEDEAIVVYGELTIEGEGTVESNSMAVWARGNEGAVINIYGGTYKGLSQELAKSGRSVVYASSGNTINIYGGTFEAKAADMTSFADKTGVYAALNIADNNGNINVYGGTFKNFNPAIPGTEPKSWNDNHPNGFVADGYSSVDMGDNTWKVIENPENKNVASTTAADLQTTINNTPDNTPTIILLKDAFTSDADKITVPANKDITIIGSLESPTSSTLGFRGASEDGVSFQGQIGVVGKLTLKDIAIYTPKTAIANEVSQFSKTAVKVTSDGELVCDNVTFEMADGVKDATAITAYWSTGDGANVIVKNCTFNCAGERPIRSDACVTIENCVFNDPYRYALQLTSKASTASQLEKAIVNFYNNTINAGTTSSKTVVYGIQLEGETYGCNDLIINGAGNVINLGETGKTSAMYYCECGKVDHNTITWNTEVAPVHEKGYSVKDDTYYIASTEGLVWFAKQVNESNNSFSGKTVALVCDIDLADIDWEPIGQTGATEFRGVFDGQGYTIKNLNVNSSAHTDKHYSSGLFGWAERGVTIKNVKVDGATVTGNHNVAVIVGYTYSGKIENCHVSNADIVCNHANADACGDKCGLIAGYAGDESRFKDCTGKDSTVKAGRDAGQLIGAGYNVSISNCSATNVEVTATGDCNEQKNINNAVIGRVLG